MSSAEPSAVAADASTSNAEKPGGLRSRALRGASFAIVHYGISNLLRFGSNLLLAHALFPEAFALVALASILLQGLQMFSDLGIGPSIIQHPRGDEPAFLNTAFTLQAIRGVALYLVAAAAAWPMARFYNEPKLVPIVLVCGLSVVIGGLWSTAPCTLQRRLQLGALTILGFGESIAKTIIIVVWSLYWPSVWTLVGASLITLTLSCIATHTLLPGRIRNRFTWDRDAAKDLLQLGRWVFASTLVTFLAQQSDRLLLGKLAPMGVLGVYSIAFTLARLPTDIGSRLGVWVLYPVIAEVARRDSASMGTKLRQSRGLILAVSQFAVAGIIIAAPWFFRVLYDDRYAEAATYTPLLAATTWFTLLQGSSDRALLVLGEPKSLAISNFANVAATIFGCVAGFAVAGMPGFIAGVGLGNLAGELVVLHKLNQRGVRLLTQDLGYTAVVAAIGLGFGWLPRVLAPDAVRLQVVVGCVGIAISGAFAYAYVRPLARRCFKDRRARGDGATQR